MQGLFRNSRTTFLVVIVVAIACAAIVGDGGPRENAAEYVKAADTARNLVVGSERRDAPPRAMTGEPGLPIPADGRPIDNAAGMDPAPTMSTDGDMGLAPDLDSSNVDADGVPIPQYETRSAE
ncbi:MAG: hypothetical protein ACR2PC_00530 [Tsuneonella suprasediminis]